MQNKLGETIDYLPLRRVKLLLFMPRPPVIPEASIPISPAVSSDAISDSMQICHRHRPFLAEVDANCFVS